MIFDFVRHSSISHDLLLQICELKRQHWEYSLEEQLDWINENLSDSDVHLFIKEKNKVISYLNLVEVKVVYSTNLFDIMFGIGNVCVDKNYLGQGLGFLIVKIAEAYIKKNKRNGILLCKSKLVAFYEKSNWSRFEGEIYINKTKINNYAFFYNKVMSNSICIEKSF